MDASSSKFYNDAITGLALDAFNHAKARAVGNLTFNEFTKQWVEGITQDISSEITLLLAHLPTRLSDSTEIQYYS